MKVLRQTRLGRAAVLAAILAAGMTAEAAEASRPVLERVSTMVPFPRGLAMVDGELYVLARGRVRGSGGVSSEVEDQAGTLYRMNPNVSEPWSEGTPSEAVQSNGEVIALPTDPPFRLWDRTSSPPESDRETDRPYCVLRWHEPTQSFYICAFSGVDLKRTDEYPVAFSKNLTDGVLRYDLRTGQWHEVERHDIRAGGNYPHHDPQRLPPPHGWLNGPDNILALGDQLYAVAKDNSLLARYDLSALKDDPQAGPPQSEVVMTADAWVENAGMRNYQGQSALAYRDGWLYIGYRTSSVIVRIPVDRETYLPVQPIQAQLLAQFDPYDPVKDRSADLTDMAFDDEGNLYVVSAQPAAVYRFKPDPEKVFDGRTGHEKPWVSLAELTANRAMKSENVLYANGWIYVTSGDGYGYQDGADGTVYRVRVE